MKNKLRYIFILFALAGMLGSCQKYLDIKKNSDLKLIETADDCQLMLDDYTLMNTNYPNEGENSADDYFLDDQAFNNTRLTQIDRDIYTWSPNVLRGGSAPQWINAYQIIYQSNLIIEATDKIQGKDDQLKVNTVKGSALFFRANCFWQLAQMYAKPHDNAAAQSPGIPLRLSSDFNDKSDRGTVAQTYARIIQDLQEAVNLLPVTTPKPTRPNKVAAYAMLARVYLSMEDYPQALTSANAALLLRSELLDYNSSAVNKSPSSSTPFSPRFNKEVIFHSMMYTHNTDAGNVMLTPGSGTTNNLAKIDPNFIATYNDNDLRKKVLFKPVGTAFRFTGNYEPVTTSALFNGLAVDELYLVRAECYARAGNITAAMKDLNDLLRTRWLSGTYVDLSAATADIALDIILKERRKELLMRGQRWTDLRRLNKDSRFARTLSRTLTIGGVLTTFTLPPNDPRYTLLIPEEVIKNSAIPQNIR